MQMRRWLAVSLTLNAGLLLALVWMWRESGATARPGALLFREETAAPWTPHADEAVWDDSSLIGTRDALRAAGVAPEQIEQVLSSMLRKQRHRAKRASSWWKGTPYGGDLRLADPVEMHREREELRRLVDGPSSIAGATEELDLDHVDAPKREAVARILRDYAEVKARNTVGGLRIRADQAREELLRAELQRDLRAVLTEEEYFEHTLRDMQSTEWVRLRMDAVSLDLTEQEFRETARALLAARSLPDTQARATAVEKIHAELRVRVGEERIFNASARNSHEFYQLREAQVRFGFPQEATDRVVAAWRGASRAAAVLRAEKTDEATRAAAWRALAGETRKEIVTALGAEAGEAYLEQSMGWLRDWERGGDTRMAGFMGRKQADEGGLSP